MGRVPEGEEGSVENNSKCRCEKGRYEEMCGKRL